MRQNDRAEDKITSNILGKTSNFLTKHLPTEMSQYIFVLQTIAHLSLRASFRNIDSGHEHEPVTQVTLRQLEGH